MKLKKKNDLLLTIIPNESFLKLLSLFKRLYFDKFD
jgi:hypothetical protein